jgi:type IV pilus assembly protein PilN
MRRVNLLPAEERRRRAAPTTTRGGILGVLLIVGALLLLVMIGLYLYYYVQLGNEEEQIAQLDQDIAKKPIADGIFRTRFPWDDFVRGLAFVTPNATALDVFTGQATPINIQVPSGGAPEVQNLEPPGFITFNGLARTRTNSEDDCNEQGNDNPVGYENVACFIVRMNNLRFLANANLTEARLDRELSAVTFEVSAELVTRVGENGDEVPIGIEEDGEGDEDEPPGPQASRPGLER